MLKEFLRLENEMLKRYHRKGDSGLRVAQARSIMIDVLVTELFNYAVRTYEKAEGPLPYEVAIVALGGYGREEVCPFSDVDLMFLYPDRASAGKMKVVQETLTNEMLYPLWDLNFKVGHSSRSTKETIIEAKADQQTKNALLESRLICGSEALYARFHKRYEAYYKKEDHLPYVKERLADQHARREKFGKTVFLQEPDIKNGVGGLRDYHSILWMAAIRLNINTLDELVAKDVLSEEDAKQLHKAYDFLLRTRNELHFMSTRPTDLLVLDKQPQIAWGLGYKQHDIFRRVEAFMRDYYTHAQNIFLTSKLIEQRLAFSDFDTNRKLTFRDVLKARRISKEKTFDGFVLRDRVIHYEEENVFQEAPARLIRIFRYMQQYDAEFDLELSALIARSLKLIDSQIISDPGCNKSFRAILQEPGEVYPILHKMNELGVLGRFVPEFGKLNCLVQHEYYHRYTADVHVLNTIAQMDEIFSGEGEFSDYYRKEIHKTEIPCLIYIMLLLHDIGKAEGIKDHDTTGVKLAAPLLYRLGVSEEYHAVILFVIQNHLEMARFWQRLDVDDPETIQSFAQLVGDPDALCYLYVHTHCDAQGTTTSFWNSYKEGLHRQLYRNTREYLKHKGILSEQQQKRKQAMFEHFLEQDIPGISREEKEAHFNLLPEKYFLYNAPEEVKLHISMINQLLKNIAEAESIGSLVPVIHWQDDIDQGLSVVNIVTWDRAGLFYKLSGAFSVAGLNILSTKAISRTDHITIDTFYVVEPGGGIVQNQTTQETFRKHVEDALLHNKDLLPEIMEQSAQSSASSSLLKTGSNQLQATLPHSVEVYHELSLKRTIVEVQSHDHMGLLYLLSKCMYDHGFDITFARISTELGVAVDTFYIENIDAQTDDHSEKLVSLREKLQNLVAEDAIRVAG